MAELGLRGVSRVRSSFPIWILSVRSLENLHRVTVLEFAAWAPFISGMIMSQPGSVREAAFDADELFGGEGTLGLHLEVEFDGHLPGAYPVADKCGDVQARL